VVYNETKFSVSRFNADSAPQPEGLRCVSVFIPDDVFHLRILAGLVGLATKATNWEGEQENRDAVALLWNLAYDATDWGDCMDCGDVQNCIETDDGVKGAIINEVNNAIQNNETTINSILQMLQNQNSPGNPMTNSGDSITPPGTFETDDVCDLDKLWSGCLYLSEYLDQLITDFFEQIAELTEAAKIVAKASGAIPVLGDYIQSALEFALALQEKVAVIYAGEQSEEVIQDIACDFFCRAQINCGLSVDDVIDVMSTRLGEISPAEFGSVIEVMITGTFEGVQIVEVAYLLALSAIKFGQQFGDALGVRPISDIMRIGASDPADSWMVICDECPSFWEHEFDFRESDHGFSLVGTWVDGVGIVSTGTGGSPYTSQVYMAVVDWADSTLTHWLIDASSTTADAPAFRGFYYPTDGGATDYGGGATGTYQLGGDSLYDTPSDFAAQISNATVPGVNVTIKLTLSGTGADPFM